jgi:hypothetical protein
MIGNDRLYMAVVALVTMEGDVRKRVCLAMENINTLRENEFNDRIDLWQRLTLLKEKTSSEGPLMVNGEVVKNAFEHTAESRINKTYAKYAKEIFDIWLETRN